MHYALNDHSWLYNSCQALQLSGTTAVFITSVRHNSCQIPQLSGTTAVRYPSCQAPQLSGTQGVSHRSCLAPKSSGTPAVMPGSGSQALQDSGNELRISVGGHDIMRSLLMAPTHMYCHSAPGQGSKATICGPGSSSPIVRSW